MGERTELKDAAANLTPWEVIQGAGIWTVLCDGWVAVDVYKTNTGDWRASKPHAAIPEFVLSALPPGVGAAIRRRTT